VNGPNGDLNQISWNGFFFL